MSQVRILIRDARRDINSTVDRELGELITDSLSAEPATIDELARATERYIDPEEWSGFGAFASGVDDRPCEGGLLVIDLPARFTVMEWNEIPDAINDAEATEQWETFYRLPDDWLMVNESQGWPTLAEERRRARKENPPVDTRAVLYGEPLLDFIARESLSTFQDMPADEESEDRYDGPVAQGVRDIHARWLTTPRDDLRGKAPRDVLLEKHDFISWDMQDRANQWSHTGECPRTLDRNTHAWRYAGFGTHEVVEYYYLVRELLWSCRDEVESLRKSDGLADMMAGDFFTTEVPRLEQVRENWLDRPDPEFHGRTPRSIIENERIRRPEAMSGHEAMIDDDCPLCQMMGDMPGPAFWHLDGCNMDWDFAFSFHRTREEYDQEEREREAFHQRFKEEQEARKRLQLEDPYRAAEDSVWKRSFVADDGPDVPLGIRLFGIGSRLADLIVDLKQSEEDRALIDQLNRDFGNLREVVTMSDASTGAALIEPVLERFGETLAVVGEARECLQDQCEDLQGSLRRFLEPPDEGIGEITDYGDDVPF